MMWLAIVAIMVPVGTSIIAVRSLYAARAQFGASLDRLGELRAAADALADTVDDVARRGGVTSDALDLPAQS